MDNQHLIYEMRHYTDAEAYVSDMALSSAWGDDPTDDIPADRIDMLTQLWRCCHSVNDLLQATGLSQSAFSRRFDIPLRTVQGWCEGSRTPPAYVLKMAAEILL